MFFTILNEKQLPFEKTFFDFHSKKDLTAAAPELKTLLEKYEIANEKKAADRQPLCTLLIDEIENIWKPIAENDDWSLFNHKLATIRKLR